MCKCIYQRFFIRQYFNVPLYFPIKSIYILYQYKVCYKFLVKPAPQINKQRRTENNVCVPILSNKSPLSLIVLKSEYHCHTFHISAEKAVLGFFFLIAFVVELITYLLYYLYFALISIKNQQYLNFEKKAKKILARFCKHIFGKHVKARSIFFLNFSRSYIKQFV